MIKSIKKASDAFLHSVVSVKKEEREKTTVLTTTEYPIKNYEIPSEGMLLSIGDVRDLSYIKTDDLIDPHRNLYFYNSSICKYKDQYRLFYRCGRNPKTCEDRIATCLLTKNLEVVPHTNKYIEVYSNWEESRKCGPDVLARHIQYYYYDVKEIRSLVYKDNRHVEDPRAIEFNNHWFIFYTDGLTVGVAKLNIDTCNVIYSHFLKVPPQSILSTQYDGREKNWIPVVANNELYILYSDTPRTFFHCKDELNKLSIINREKFGYNVKWSYGDIRGGCPPISYDDNLLIWFFHSSTTIYCSLPIPNSKIYFIGAYVTKNTYPFEILKISTFPIFFGTPSHIRTNLHYQSNVVFPCGAVREDNTFIISMGINDYCIGHLKINKKDIIWKDLKKEYMQLSVI